MTWEMVLGALIVAAGGLVMGAGAWPMKLMRTFQFEHWWFLSILFGLIVIPWSFSLLVYPNLFAVYADVPPSNLILSNLLALVWGVANILCGICYVRIGIALTQAILAGLGSSVLVIIPLIFKGSGQFQNAADVLTPAGLTVLSGLAVMLFGVILAALAGFGRDQELKRLQQPSGSFFGGLIMTVIAGVFSAGLWLAFIYSQGPIVCRITTVKAGGKIDVIVTDNEAISSRYLVGRDGTIRLSEKACPEGTVEAKSGRKKAAGQEERIPLPGIKPIPVAGLSAKAAAEKIAGALGLEQKSDADAKVRVETGDFFAVFPVWAIGALSGALLNLLYPAYLMTKKRSWGVLLTNWKEVGFSAIMGLQTGIAISLPAKGMILLGALGASVGSGIQQAMQMVGGQGTGFISGEWRGVYDKSRWQMYMAIETLVLAALIMAYSNTIPK
jgi:hypothetical protein